MEYNFLPKWYKLKIRKRNKLILNMIVIILFLINIFMIYRIYDIDRNMLMTKNTYKPIDKKKNNTVNESKDRLTLNNFMNFLKFKSIDKFYTVTVKQNNIEVNFKINNMDDYELYTKDIEDKKDYKIIKLMAPEDKTKDIKLFQADIEVKK
ncbi:hypothetical protein SAMN02745134_00384 [Clostridium acidisoli DSM 12555]|uniref:Uncharacterized protein n=1 Tax=Clostridium acidisoli DSM 12555 TaxID=1121291 RepID=A0A1W1X0X9_9CLOT|nr:hypothetical protein [Clostridium acidisoli]SMC17602.1 hypothetical protein SAMN02745134_00384 [Clostridium acidisoli DSM 12555]